MDRIALPGATVDFRREEVRRCDGAHIELRPQSFSVLRRLAAKPGELVTKDELLTECWPGVIVTEDSLVQCVSDIRKALGASGRDLIRTVPRRGYVLVLPEARELREAVPAPSRPQPSVAVLPFDEFGADSAQGALGAGFAEDITTELARNRHLTVLARHTSFKAKAQGKTPAEITGAFGVRYVLEGSIRRLGERVIVNAQLIDGRDSQHVWAERYSFTAAELFTVQDELATRIAGTLFSEIREGELAASLRRPPASLNVYELVTQGDAHQSKLTREDIIAARALLERAVTLDPHYALAHIFLGYTVATDAGMAISGTVGPDALPGAIASIRRGMELDPTFARGYEALSYALFLSGQFDEALLAAERGAALGPGDAEVLNFLGVAQVGVGQYDAALASIERAIELNPLAPGYYLGIAAVALYALGRFEEASGFATAAAERSRGFTNAYVIGAAADMALGRATAAKARIAALLRQSPSFTMQAPRVAQAYARDPKLRPRFVQHLREAGMPEKGTE